MFGEVAIRVVHPVEILFSSVSDLIYCMIFNTIFRCSKESLSLTLFKDKFPMKKEKGLQIYWQIQCAHI